MPGSDRPWAHGFRISFTPLAGVLFTVPSRYWFAIGRRGYLALGGGPPRFPPDSACPAVLTQEHHPTHPAVTYGTLTPSGGPFQRPSVDWVVGAKDLPTPPRSPFYPPTAPAAASTAVGVWAPPRSLAATRGILSLPPGTEMFQFPGCPPRRSRVPGYHPRRVAPFGYPRIAGCQRLPGAFRRVATPFIGPRRLGIHRAPVSAVFPHPGQKPGGTAHRAHVSLPPSSIHTHALLLPHPPPRAPAVARSALATGVASGAVRAAGGRLPPGRSREGSPPARLVVKVHPACQAPVARVPGGATGARTPNLRRARAALSQLSYGPRSSPGDAGPRPGFPRGVGGRAWTRTRGLGLIRAAL